MANDDHDEQANEPDGPDEASGGTADGTAAGERTTRGGDSPSGGGFKLPNLPKLPSLPSMPNLGEAVIRGVDSAVSSRWDAARQRASLIEGDSTEARVQAATRTFARELGVVGAAGGALAAAPGVGTAAAVATGAADIGTFAMRAGDLILTVAAIHGIDEASVEERRAWVLSVLAFGDAAAVSFLGLARELGKEVGSAAGERVPAAVLKEVNSSLAKSVVLKYGTKRGAIALGRALPFGFGAVVGGSLNYAGTRTIGRQAHAFFTDVSPTELALGS